MTAFNRAWVIVKGKGAPHGIRQCTDCGRITRTGAGNCVSRPLEPGLNCGGRLHVIRYPTPEQIETADKGQQERGWF